jgi:hypothetical protein
LIILEKASESLFFFSAQFHACSKIEVGLCNFQGNFCSVTRTNVDPAAGLRI